MTERTVTHSTFAIERTYDSSPSRVFAAWSDPVAKKRWFAGHEETSNHAYSLDFRVGGREYSRGEMSEGQSYSFDALYQDIIPNERIVYSYDLLTNETRISVSLTTVEFKQQESGTQLIFTEQGAFLDGHDSPKERESGTGSLLEALAAELQRNEKDS